MSSCLQGLLPRMSAFPAISTSMYGIKFKLERIIALDKSRQEILSASL